MQFVGLDCIASIVPKPWAGQHGVQIPQTRDFSLLQKAHPVSSSMCRGGSSRGEAAGEWGWSLTSI